MDPIFDCIGCGVDTSKINEYYMVFMEVWLAANPKDKGMLCIGCLEGKLGRKLTPGDFTHCAVNVCFGNANDKSERLRDRLGDFKWENEMKDLKDYLKTKR